MGNFPTEEVNPTRDWSRVTKEGVKFGEPMSRIADTQAGILIADGEWEKDERCNTCAFRFGTVPNGCLQTQMDTHKAVYEKKPFLCHCQHYDDDKESRKVCSGWFAAMQHFSKVPAIECPWEFSEPDSE